MEEKLKKRLGNNVLLASTLMQRAFNEALDGNTDLNARQVILMMMLKHDKTMSFDHAEKVTALDGKLLNDLLDILFVRKYIELIDEMTFRLTSKGDDVLMALWPIIEETENKIFQNFTENEKEHLYRYSERIQQRCEYIINK